MANSRSARKRIRANERKHQRNKAVRSSVRTKVTKVRRALFSGETVNVEAELKAAVSALDRAAEKGILHRNNAIRRKSRLTAMAHRLMRAAAEADDEQAAALRAAAAGGEKGRSGRAAKTAAKPAAKAATKPAAKPATKRATPARAATTSTGTRATTTRKRPSAGAKGDASA